MEGGLIFTAQGEFIELMDRSIETVASVGGPAWQTFRFAADWRT
jgi:hypothetical protein